MKNKVKPISVVIITAILTFGISMSATSLFAGEWLQPTALHPSGGYISPVKNEGTTSSYYTPRALEVEGNFLVGARALYVNNSSQRVGIGTEVPAVTLDVDGPVKVLNSSFLPVCSSSIVGAIVYSTSANMPYVCTASGWLKLQVDIDGDGQAD